MDIPVYCFAQEIVGHVAIVGEEDEEWLVGRCRTREKPSRFPLDGLWDFLDAAGAPAAMAEFVQAYGVLQPEHLQPRPGMPRAVRKAVERGDFAAAFDQVDVEREQFRKLVALDAVQPEGASQYAKAATTLDAHLAKVHLGTSWRRGERSSFLQAPFVLDALYAILWAGPIGVRGEAVCPHCASQFFKKKSSQKFCSPRCYNNAKQKRWQARARAGEKA